MVRTFLCSRSLFLYLGLFMCTLHSLHRRLSLIADSTSIGCSVGWVELCSRVFWFTFKSEGQFDWATFLLTQSKICCDSFCQTRGWVTSGALTFFEDSRSNILWFIIRAWKIMVSKHVLKRRSLYAENITSEPSPSKLAVLDYFYSYSWLFTCTWWVCRLLGISRWWWPGSCRWRRKGSLETLGTGSTHTDGKRSGKK